MSTIDGYMCTTEKYYTLENHTCPTSFTKQIRLTTDNINNKI